MNLALVLTHDQLLAGGIQAGDGPVKQAIMRHKTRLHSELQKIKIKRGIASNIDLAQNGDCRAGLSYLSFCNLNRTDLRWPAQIPRYVRVNTLAWSLEDALKSFVDRGFTLTSPFESE